MGSLADMGKTVPEVMHPHIRQPDTFTSVIPRVEDERVGLARLRVGKRPFTVWIAGHGGL